MPPFQAAYALNEAITTAYQILGEPYHPPYNETTWGRKVIVFRRAARIAWSGGCPDLRRCSVGTR